jgi:transcriptional regulator with XRE-family HTH domain
MTALLREVIGDVLRRARVEQGRTLREVSDSARVSLGYLSEVERGRKEASSELLSAICGALDIPLSRVLSEAGDGLALEESRAAISTVTAGSGPAGTAGIDVTTKVVIPQVVSMAVA